MSSENEDEHDEAVAEVRVSGCDIYYYGDVDRKNILEFVEKFKALEVDLLKKRLIFPDMYPQLTCVYAATVVMCMRV